MLIFSWLVDHPQVIGTVGSALLGYAVAMVVSYVKFAQDLSYIKGQLQAILDLHLTVKDLQTKHATMERDTIQNIRDIEKTFSRLKVLETKIFKKGACHEPTN